MNSDINKELIFNYFSGRASALQKKGIEEWAEIPAHREQFFVWLQEWEQQNSQYYPDTEKGMARHRARMQQLHTAPNKQEEELILDEKKPAFGISRINWLVAATIALAVLSGAWLFRDNIRYQMYRTDFSEIQRITLTDGSKVVLNANSSLHVPRFGFGSKTREVILNGEADFDIVHTKDHQRFIVKTSKTLEIVVLGTQFNVYTRPRGTKVILNQGKVQLNYQEGTARKKLTMKPGDLVTMDVYGRASLRKTDNPEKFSAWKAHRFVFDKTTLREVCHLFEDNFGVTVQIPDSSLAQLTISGSFTALNAEELLGILTDDSGLNYQKSPDGETIILSY
ncbi:hypothetical protein DYBT9275_02466 [Dyadobacter sp. CECT 9275]|uniref:FecR family protein n=1 Tax=Dyadobacter helix TaxID=2822344 RepID=A0A916JD45_9BACT|nr:FecR domain-containing protein [Dyadobacter sp. CECT 9275]CAG5000451.1 hypothetical protein DYBT9275_02466 [Dyadobacter sp. CECT 9275]